MIDEEMVQEDSSGADSLDELGFDQLDDQVDLTVQDDSILEDAHPVAGHVDVIDMETGFVGRYNVQVQEVQEVEEEPTYAEALQNVQDLQLGLGILMTALVGLIIGFMSGKELLKIWMHY